MALCCQCWGRIWRGGWRGYPQLSWGPPPPLLLHICNSNNTATYLQQQQQCYISATATTLLHICNNNNNATYLQQQQHFYISATATALLKTWFTFDYLNPMRCHLKKLSFQEIPFTQKILKLGKIFIKICWCFKGREMVRKSCEAKFSAQVR